MSCYVVRIVNNNYILGLKPLITNTSEEFIKCRLDSFSIGFILYYINLTKKQIIDILVMPYKGIVLL